MTQNNCLILLALFFITFIIITHKTEIKEQFSSFGLTNTYTNIEDAVQGIAIDKNNFFPINVKSISKHDINTGKKIKQLNLSSHPRINKLHDGVSVGNKLFICNQKENKKNTIEVFNKNLEHQYHINVSGDKGVLTWIDYFQDKWWGCFSHFKQDTQYTIVVEFYTSTSAIGADSLMTRDTKRTLDVEKPEPNWHIRNRWFLPFKVHQSFSPNSCSGGSFDSKGNLYLTSHYKKQLYVMGFHPTSPMMNLNHVKTVGINGQGISWDRKRNILIGINPDEESVYLYSYEKNMDLSKKPDYPITIQKPKQIVKKVEILDNKSYFVDEPLKSTISLNNENTNNSPIFE